MAPKYRIYYDSFIYKVYKYPTEFYFNNLEAARDYCSYHNNRDKHFHWFWDEVEENSTSETT